MINPISRLKSEIKVFKRFPHFLGWKLIGNKKTPINTIVHIIDGGDWVIKRVGNYIASGTSSRGLHCKLDTSPRFYFNSIIHFGSINTFVRNISNKVNTSNKLIATIFHGGRDINPQMDAYIDRLITYQNRLTRIVVSNSIMEDRLISWGISREKLVLIPIGVDLSHFKPAAPDIKKKLRNELGIPDDAICIGSFQKDGNGWGEGLKPKWIKGPDVFVKVVTQLAKKHKVHCLLTGPARGYVKEKLKTAGISYTHRMLKNYLDIVDYYNCLDLYIVTSREEGGPKALMESMATGVPLVSTRVGMAPDIIQEGKSGFMVDVDDVDGIVRCAETILEDKEIQERIIHNGLQTVKKYDWDIVAGQYAELYRKVMKETSYQV